MIRHRATDNAIKYKRMLGRRLLKDTNLFFLSSSKTLFIVYNKIEMNAFVVLQTNLPGDFEAVRFGFKFLRPAPPVDNLSCLKCQFLIDLA